ncbi:MAG TPA: DUF2079 domain-containing protein, partial [Pilimelia sp.]|nr:DUF2079 domain-containing protein [Pilimelia sp.]
MPEADVVRPPQVPPAPPDTARPAGAAAGTAATAGRTGPAVLAAALCAVYCAISLLKFRDLRSTGFDLAIFTEAVRSYAALEAPVVELKGAGFHLLGDHFHPVLVTLAPWYRVFPTPVTLLVAQAVLFAVSAYVVGRYAVDRLGRGPGLCLGAVYGLSYGVQRAVAFDFHEVAFAVPLIAVCVVALARRRWAAAACWALPLFLVKEDQALIVAGMGAYIFWRGSRWIGAALAAGAVAAGAVTIFVVIPAFNAHHHYDYLHS